MVRKIQAKLVLRLHGQGLSGRAIARSQGMSRRSVADVLDEMLKLVAGGFTADPEVANWWKQIDQWRGRDSLPP